jgi:hypothetical protein
MRRAVIGLTHACGLIVLFAIAPAEAACTGSEVKATARGGIGALTVTWNLVPPCDVAETGLLLGSELSMLTKVGAAVRRVDAGYSSTVPVFETGVYWVAAYVVDTAGNMITSEPEFAPVLVFDDDTIEARAPSCSIDPA